ncbi:MAG: cytochrome c [bacterium]|nr:cytochrome c [bacterium]
MKRYLLVTITLLILVACAAKKKAAAEKSLPTEGQLMAVQKKFPDATMANLQKGHELFYGKCTRCHGPKNISKRSEKEWPKILDKMAPRAKLSPEDKDAVYKYVMSVKLGGKSK